MPTTRHGYWPQSYAHFEVTIEGKEVRCSCGWEHMAVIGRPCELYPDDHAWAVFAAYTHATDPDDDGQWRGWHTYEPSPEDAPLLERIKKDLASGRHVHVPV